MLLLLTQKRTMEIAVVYDQQECVHACSQPRGQHMYVTHSLRDTSVCLYIYQVLRGSRDRERCLSL